MTTIASPADNRWIKAAIAQANVALEAGDVPVGALIVFEDRCIAKAENRTVRLQDPTAHAELLAIREASAALSRWRLSGCTLYVTLEPCAMCAGAIVLARLDRVVFAAWDEKAGMAGSLGDIVRHPKLNHRAEVLGGVMAPEAGEVLRQFFRERRNEQLSPEAG